MKKRQATVTLTDRGDARAAMPEKLKVNLRTVNRKLKRQPHPTLDDDAQIKQMLSSVFSTMFRFWDPEYVRSGELLMPPLTDFRKMLKKGMNHSDLRGVLEMYVDNFYPKVPEDEALAELFAKSSTPDPFTDEELRYIAEYILKEHQ